jgi:hypothetical protein
VGEKKEGQHASMTEDELLIDESELSDDIAKIEDLMDKECVAD